MSSRKTPSRRGDYSSAASSPVNGTSANFESTSSSTTGGSGLAGGTSSPNPSSTSQQDNATDGRRRQAYRDEAIRRKINTSLAKRVNADVTRARQTRRPPPGSVLSLRPSPPLTMKLSTTVYEAAQFMAAKRENCVLVTDDDDTVCGIFTAKDLAFRVVGMGFDSKAVTIDQIMTRNPMCARTDTSATEALNLMVSKGFRHLPIMDENKDVAGVLDITKCFHEAMDKLERAYKSSRKLHDALEGVQFESGSSQAAQIINYVENLKQRMEGPDLDTVLDESTTPVFVNIKTNAYEAAVLMKEKNTTAVLVTENNHITGIVTSKDIVLRVIAAGFNPKICSLVRVMTPQPDFAAHTTTIQTALKKMHDGNYLNLPVMGDNQEIVGMVDVLTLTYATLEQINSMSNTGEDAENPTWNNFWMSLDDHDSVHSDNSHNNTRSVTPGSSIRPGSAMGAGMTSPPDVSRSELAEFNIDAGMELGPNDSVSLADEREAAGTGVETPMTDLDVPYPFKFKAPSGRVHRITVAPTDGLIGLRHEITYKIKPEEVEALGGAGEMEDGKLVSPGFAVSYVDDEGDVIAITSDRDLIDAIQINRALGHSKADIYIHHPDEHINIQPPLPASAAAAESVTSPVSSTPPTNRREGYQRRRQLRLTMDGEEGVASSSDSDEGGASAKSSRRRRKNGGKANTSNNKSHHGDSLIPGVPNELILPGAIVALAASILVVFVFSRSHSR